MQYTYMKNQENAEKNTAIYKKFKKNRKYRKVQKIQKNTEKYNNTEKKLL